jgi:galactose mutarotase-like enzyme
VITSIQNQWLKVTSDSQGAELISLIKNNSEYLWQADPRFWPRHAPILFPIVGKLENDQYQIGPSILSMSQHGFARDRKFTLAEEKPDGISYETRSDEQTLKIYPFQFALSVRYQLEGNKLIVLYSVKNIDHQRIWFSVGAHPGFCFGPGETFSDYVLKFDLKETAERHFLEKGIFSGKTERVLNNSDTLALSDRLFENDAVIFKYLKSEAVTVRHKSGHRDIRVAFRGFPYLGIWSKPGAPFVCIEPWHGIADTRGSGKDFREKEGMQSLGPDEIFDCHYTIEID